MNKEFIFESLTGLVDNSNIQPIEKCDELYEKVYLIKCSMPEFYHVQINAIIDLMMEYAKTVAFEMYDM